MAIQAADHRAASRRINASSDRRASVRVAPTVRAGRKARAADGTGVAGGIAAAVEVTADKAIQAVRVELRVADKVVEAAHPKAAAPTAEALRHNGIT